MQTLPEWTLPLDAVGPDDTDAVGGKAAGLARLHRAGLPVPPVFVLTRAAFGACAGQPAATEPMVRLQSAVEDGIRRLRRQAPAVENLMVRSSAAGEDGSARSFAGIYESFRVSVAADDVLSRVADCWAALDSPRARAYRGGPAGPDDFMAVLVQARIPARFAGVAFTRDPTTDGTAALVEVVGGDAATLVDGTAEALRFRVDRHHPERVAPLGDAAAPASAGLPVDVVEQVTRLALRAENALGAPQDVEWVLDPDGQLWLVQSRPIPQAPRREAPDGSRAPGDGFVRAHGERFTTYASWLELEKARRYRSTLRWIKGPLHTWQVRFVNGRFHLREASTRVDRLFERVAGPVWCLRGDEVLADYEPAVARYRRCVQTWRDRSRTAATSGESHAALGELVEAYLRFAGDESIAAGHVANLFSGLLARAVRRLLPGAAMTARELLLGISTVIQRRDEELWQAVRGPASADAVERWSRSYGYVWADRNAKDPGWCPDLDRRRLLVDGLRAAAPDASPAARLEAARRRARAAEERVAAAIAALPRGTRRLTAALFDAILRRARASFPLREERNHDFYSGVMAIREALDALGVTLAREGLLVRAEHVRELSHPEIGELVGGNRGLRDVAGERFRSAAAADTDRADESDAVEHAGESGILAGVAASGGRVEGPARVVRDWEDAGDLKQGEILVCSAIRPYLTPLLLVAGGLVTDRGSVLSHGANLAREYGIPAVLAVAGATRRIVTGDRIEVDGDRGRVVVISDADGRDT